MESNPDTYSTKSIPKAVLHSKLLQNIQDQNEIGCCPLIRGHIVIFWKTTKDIYRSKQFYRQFKQLKSTLNQ